ncbi:hypothetical protein SAMN05421504_108172 [Amycolatopsis xylanica]|uniref:Uncharacterized protein n=1 Tax=Amycolatopsis xylanica TaxID=589385 RepID=A0A1H3PEA7_9PSEU|nr:hypothetical protein [Amycolatopsis xylanica]SDY99407.1 hypothetical protein SAMN05421504_108172 [Amycolatopsis xylanica]
MSRQASIGGRGSRFMHRVLAVCFWLPVLIVPALFVFGELDLTWWQAALVIGGVLFSVFLGFSSWWDADEERDDTARLLAAGRQAVAEILEVEVEDSLDDSTEMAVLRLRIAGPEVPSFDAWCRAANQPEFRAGVRLKATVDPADNLFTLRPL